MFRPEHVAGIRALAEAWQAELVVIGAGALVQWHGLAWRVSDDLDLLVAVDVESERLVLPDGWRQGKAPQRIYSPAGARFDVVPAGPRLRAAGVLEWGDGRRLNLAGAELAFRHAVVVKAGDVEIRVAPTPVIVVLKMAAYLDRPQERSRDLVDIAHVLHVYVADDDDRRFDEGLGLGLAFELLAAYLLGKDIGRVTANRPDLISLIQQFMMTAEGAALGELTRGAPRTWAGEEGVLEQLSAFRRGLEDGWR